MTENVKSYCNDIPRFLELVERAHTVTVFNNDHTVKETLKQFPVPCTYEYTHKVCQSDYYVVFKFINKRNFTILHIK